MYSITIVGVRLWNNANINCNMWWLNTTTTTTFSKIDNTTNKQTKKTKLRYDLIWVKFAYDSVWAINLSSPKKSLVKIEDVYNKT